MDALAAFRAHVMADASLQQRLAAIAVPETFEAEALAIAGAAGIELDASELRRTPGDVAPIVTKDWPSSDWRPVACLPTPDGVAVDWAHFAGARLREPFYYISLQQARWSPFNRLFLHRTMFDDFVARAPTPRDPNGFIFHMSRCGSTLVANMLGALPGAVAISEAPPLDAVLTLGGDVAALRTMIGALVRPRRGEHRAFVKLDSWHILALPLFRRAFPSVPWIFLYRDPAEVLVSQMRARGVQTVPGMVPLIHHALGDMAGLTEEESCARVLAHCCAAAAEGMDEKGQVVAYAELPAGVERRIAPHFGLTLDAADRAALAEVARRDAKHPYQGFTGDVAAKQQAATPAIRAAAARYLAEPIAALDALSASSPR